MSLKELQLAALLHDIGKFYQRAGIPHHKKYKNLSRKEFGQNGAHGKWSATFTSKFGMGDEVEDLVLYHHLPSSSGYPKMAKILQKADHHSSKERSKSEEKSEVNKEPLISIFSKVKLSGDNQPAEYYLPLKSLDAGNLANIKPNESKQETRSGWNLEPDYLNLWQAFEKEMENLNGYNDFNTIYYLLKKYTSLMPSAAYVDYPDISLFDHLKTTAALATCLFYHSQENELKSSHDINPYLIVNGDISGIQKFIYNISSPQEAQKGMSKRLRGRSFYLNLISDVIVNKIIHGLGLSPANILFCGGGHFILILPNTESTARVINAVSREINYLFIQKFNADIYLALSSKSCSGDDLEDFGKVMNDMSFENQKNKRSKFIEFLEDVFKDETEIIYKTCPVCGKKNESPNEFCGDCLDQEMLGTKIANAKYIIRTIVPSGKVDFQEMGVGYCFESEKKSLLKKMKELGESEKLEVLTINNSDLSNLISEFKGSENISVGFTVLGNTVPKHSYKGTLYFNHLAEISKGSNKMGILKMDVDNLGKVFFKGLKNRSISRVSTMSSFMDLFFSGYINQIAERYRVLEDVCPSCQDKVDSKKIELLFGEENPYKVEFYRETNGKVCSECEKTAVPTIYITYSGGDDLVVLGPYDDIILFSQELRNEFKEWTCQNQDITISAGIFIGGPRFPAERGVKFSDNFLETSKSCGKDMITIFNETVRWEDHGSFKGFSQIMGFAKKLENLSRNGKISKSLVYSMLLMWQDTFSSISSKPAKNISEWNSQNKIRLQKKRYVPMFKYKLRTVKNRETREELDKEGLKFMPWIKIPASWVSLRTR